MGLKCCCCAAAAAVLLLLLLPAGSGGVHSLAPQKQLNAPEPGYSCQSRTSLMGSSCLSKPVTGRGSWKYDNGDYDGEWKDGQRHGRGKYVFASGNIYEGDWVKDKKHGTGKDVFACGDTYEGGYSEGKRCGRGKFVYDDGGTSI